MMKNISRTFEVLGAFVLLSLLGCTGKEGLSKDSDEVTMSEDGSMATIDLRKGLANEDTIDAQDLIGKDNINGELLKIKFEYDAEVLHAEKVTHLYPIICSGQNGNNDSKFIYLFNLEFTDVVPLNVTDGVIDYHALAIGYDQTNNDFFANITQDEIESAIDKVPEEYSKKGTDLSYGDSWESDKGSWKKISQSYKPGQLNIDRNGAFEIKPYEIDLIVTFKDKDGEFTKTFHDIEN